MQLESRMGLAKLPPDLEAQLLAEHQRMMRRLLNVPRLAELAFGTRVGTTPADVVLRSQGFQLLRYRRDTPARYAEPVVLCYALINRPYILDLLPERSVVGRYLDEGFDVYLIDWATPSDQDRGRTLAHYVTGFLREAVQFVLQTHRRQDLHLLGYCMGGTLSALHAAIDPGSVRTLTLLAAPIDFSGRDSLLHLWTDRKHFDVDAFIDRYGNCPAWFLQTCFLCMKPVQNFLEKNLSLFEQMDELQSLVHYFAMERWINDNVPVAGETFRQFVKDLYQDNALVRGALRLGDCPIDLGRIVAPLLLLTASNDHLVAPSSTEGIRPHVGSRDIHSMTIQAGHVGLVVGGKAIKTIWPQATRWMAERSAQV
jgi:polyhydroxyalkanoate synthase